MSSSTKFRCHARQTFYPYLRIVSGILVLSLALTSIVDYYYLSSSNRISALTEEMAFINGQVEDGVHLSYYSSIFSNLSRGLPIDEGISNAVSPNGQQEDGGDNSNPSAADQGLQQEQELQIDTSNTSP
ncbi:MAG: hypothetical protein WA941_06885 [Nitrososphaeraceae archaeon]